MSKRTRGWVIWAAAMTEALLASATVGAPDPLPARPEALKDTLHHDPRAACR